MGMVRKISFTHKVRAPFHGTPLANPWQQINITMLLLPPVLLSTQGAPVVGGRERVMCLPRSRRDSDWGGAAASMHDDIIKSRLLARPQRQPGPRLGLLLLRVVVTLRRVIVTHTLLLLHLVEAAAAGGATTCSCSCSPFH